MDVFRRLSARAVPSGKTTELTVAHEAAWYGRHTHLMIEMQGGTVGGRGGSRSGAPCVPCTAVVRDFETYFHGTLCGQIRDSRLPSNCHQRSQIQANASKRTQQTEASIQLILLGIVRERFPALEEISITNRLLYHRATSAR